MLYHYRRGRRRGSGRHRTSQSCDALPGCLSTRCSGRWSAVEIAVGPGAGRGIRIADVAAGGARPDRTKARLRGSTCFRPSRLAFAGAMAVLRVAAFVVGRYWPRTMPGAVQPPAAASDRTADRVLLVAVSDHLDRSQMALIELVNTEPAEKVDISTEQEWVRDLVPANRLYRQTASEAGEAGMASLLDDLERVLLEIAHSPSTMSSEEFNEIRQRIESQGIIFKVRVLGSDVRERQLEAARALRPAAVLRADHDPTDRVADHARPRAGDGAGRSRPRRSRRPRRPRSRLREAAADCRPEAAPGRTAARQIDEQALEEFARKARPARDQAWRSSARRSTLDGQQVADVAGQGCDRLGQTRSAGRLSAARTQSGSTTTAARRRLDSGKWQAAVDAFDQVIKAGGAKTDGARYWKAYAQNRLGQRSEALATLDELIKKFPNSRWASEAKALQVEVRQLVGQPVRPEQESDEELKLLAIRGLLNTRSRAGRADAREPRAGQRLAEAEGPGAVRARDERVAEGAGDPRRAWPRARATRTCSSKAIKYLGTRNAEQNRPLLVEIYKSTTDVDVKRRVIDALIGIGPECLRRLHWAATYDAARLLSGRSAHGPGQAQRRQRWPSQNDLWALYQAESEIQLKKQMLQALAAAQSEKILELARTEKNQELRQTAIQNLGMMSSSKTGELLMSLYKDEKDPDLKKAIVRGLFLQRNAHGARADRPAGDRPRREEGRRREAVDDEGQGRVDYMIELLKK